MTTISAKSILASVNAANTEARVDTLLLRYPRWIHAEGRTHRLIRIEEDTEIAIRTPSLMEDANLSRNASSSRAIPVSRLIQDVLDDPAVPLYWGKNQKGMTADEECTELVEVAQYYESHQREDMFYRRMKLVTREAAWLDEMQHAIVKARAFDKAGYHKQQVNRLLEPYSHITVVATATNWSNFLALRDHPDAEPHICMLAKAVRKALDEAKPQVLKQGEWHLPFVGIDDLVGIHAGAADAEQATEWSIKLSVARCASTSYNTVEGFEMTPARAFALHDRLLSSKPPHASPLEHQASADGFGINVFKLEDGAGWANPHLHGNFVGWCQYRKQIQGECQ